MNVVDLINSLLHGASRAPQLAQGLAVDLQHNLLAIVLITAPLLGLLAGAQIVLTRRALADRAGVEFLPGPGFDPGEEDILRFAHHLARAQASASRWKITPRRATGVRIRLTSTGGPPSYHVEARSRTLALISRHAYTGCELRDSERQETRAQGLAITFQGPVESATTGEDS